MKKIRTALASAQARYVAFATVLLFGLANAANASAAADPTTGIDYKVDVADKVIAAAQPAILAGLAILVLVMAISLGKRLWGKVSGVR